MFCKHAKPRAGVEKFSSDGEKIFVTTLRNCRGGEMADALALGASGSNPMEVQVLSPAPVVTCSELFQFP